MCSMLCPSRKAPVYPWEQIDPLSYRRLRLLHFYQNISLCNMIAHDPAVQLCSYLYLMCNTLCPSRKAPVYPWEQIGPLSYMRFKNLTCSQKWLKYLTLQHDCTRSSGANVFIWILYMHHAMYYECHPSAPIGANWALKLFML